LAGCQHLLARFARLGPPRAAQQGRNSRYKPHGGPKPAVRLVVAMLSLACASTAFAQTAGAPKQGVAGKGQFRVCADPENLPHSNQKQEGFENKIADLLARELGQTTFYVWWGQRRGFIRNTMNATLEEGRCDVVIGVPEGYDLVRTTKPYYRSTYVFVYKKDQGPQVKSLDDPVLKKVKIGVHLLGDDYTNPPPVHELSKRGVVGNLVGFSTFYSAENPPSAIIDAVASGKVDVAIVWGPAAGFFVKQQRVPLTMVRVPTGKGDLPFEFGMSMGVKPGNDALRLRLEKVIDSRREEITKILKDYNVPLIDQKAGPTR
jgi:quinoprotein dehydrogenase-associated probable ABC transporter substrate-binding protein